MTIAMLMKVFAFSYRISNRILLKLVRELFISNNHLLLCLLIIIFFLVRFLEFIDKQYSC